MTKFKPKTKTATDAKPVLAIILIKQLDKWIEDCQEEEKVFSERGMVIHKARASAMKAAYMNVRTVVENNS
jgi:hypothetical protein